MRKHLKIVFSGGVAVGIAFAAVAVPLIVLAGSGVQASVNIIIIPNAPSNLTATAISQTEVELSWTNNATNNTGFVVERETGSSGFVQIATVMPDITTYYDTSVSGNNTYVYRVAAFDGDGFSSYSNTATVSIVVTTPPPPPSPGGSGGGSGGGSAPYVPPSTSQAAASFKGIAYPMSNITLLENGQFIATTQAGPDANFEIDLSGVSLGTNNFTIYAVDPSGSRSTTQTFQISVTAGATTVVSGIFFAPTISADKAEVKKGDVETFFGYTVPQATVTVTVHSADPITKTVSSDVGGVWKYQLNTEALAYGGHTASAYATTDSGVTPDSAITTFMVGDADVAAPPSANTSCAALKGDFNQDCKVNLVDFSILAYWYGRANPPAEFDLNGDGKVDLVDFSILAYYWTG
jgi:hypothetical protein